MANEEHPEVTLHWPGTDTDDDRRSAPRRSPRHEAGPTAPEDPAPPRAVRDAAAEPGVPNTEPSARNLLRLRLPTHRHRAGAEDTEESHDDNGAQNRSEIAHLNAEVSRLRAEVDLLSRRVEELEQ